MAKRTTPRSQSQADDAPGTPAPRRTRRPRVQPTGETKGESFADNSIASSDMPDADAFGPSEDDIRLRAYHRYLERGGGHGMDFQDWLEAERELRTSSRAKR